MSTPTEADRHHSEKEYADALAKEFEDAPDDDDPNGHDFGISTMPKTRTDVTAMKDEVAVAALPGGVAEARLSDPATSHEAAKVATRSLRRRMADVLQTFQWAATEAAKTPATPFLGMTDEELARSFAAYGFKGSPSGIRTARKDLCRAGLLEPRMIGTVEDTRPTALGNPAIVYVLTDAGAAFDQAPYE